MPVCLIWQRQALGENWAQAVRVGARCPWQLPGTLLGKGLDVSLMIFLHLSFKPQRFLVFSGKNQEYPLCRSAQQVVARKNGAVRSK